MMGTITFGSRLRQLRELGGISRRDLAARSRLSEAYLEKVERGYNAPPAALTIVDIAKGIGADSDELFALSGKLPPDLERQLCASPLLVQVVRIAARWNSAELKGFLVAQGMESKKLDWLGATSSRNDERRVSREAVTAEMKRAVFHLDSHECVYCSSPTLLEVDHIQPVSLGGTNDIENLVACCAKCNKKKGNRSTPFPMVFGRFREEVEA